MAFYYDTHQWYQSRRSSAAQQKIEKEIEMETNGSDFLPQCHYDKSPETFDEKLSLTLKRIDELIERNKKSSQKMIDEQFRPRNHSDFSSNHVSTDPQKFGCEEASIEEPSLSTNGEESHQFIEAGAVLDFQVSLQTKNSKSYKKYKHYSAVELDDRRDRGLCLWCDEFWFIGHDCCKKKKLYVFELDEELVEGEVFHCDEHLVEDCVEKDSYALRNITCADGIENWESSEAMCKNYTIGNHELKVFEELLENDALEIFDEIFVTHPTDVESNRLWTLDATVGCLVAFTASKALWLDDIGSRKSMATVIIKELPKCVGLLNFSLMLRRSCQWWVSWPKLPLPPPEPPPRLIFCEIGKSWYVVVKTVVLEYQSSTLVEFVEICTLTSSVVVDKAAEVSKIHIVAGMPRLEENGDYSTYGTSLRLDSLGSMKLVGDTHIQRQWRLKMVLTSWVWELGKA